VRQISIYKPCTAARPLFRFHTRTERGQHTTRSSREDETMAVRVASLLRHVSQWDRVRNEACVGTRLTLPICGQRWQSCGLLKRTWRVQDHGVQSRGNPDVQRKEIEYEKLQVA